METLYDSTTQKSVNAEDVREAGPFYKQLHSRFTRFKRAIHVVMLIAVLYLGTLLVLQFTGFIQQQNYSHSALGESSSRFELQQQFASLIAKQWQDINSQSEQSTKAFLDNWSALPNVLGISVYTKDGRLLASSPNDFSYRSVVDNPEEKIVATASFSDAQASAGYVVLVVNEQTFNTNKVKAISNRIDSMLVTILLGIITGIYILRGFFKLRAKIRK